MPIYTNKADGYTMVHFGQGDLVVSTNGEQRDEVIITPSEIEGVIGADDLQFAGKPTDALPVGIRMVFDKPESAQVVIDALQKIAPVQDGTELSVSSLVGFMTKEALVEIGIGSTKVQLSPEEARHHALSIFACASAAEADLFFVEFAVGRIGTDMDGAAHLLREFRDWRASREAGNV